MNHYTFIIKDKRNNDVYHVHGCGDNVGAAKEDALMKLSLQQNGRPFDSTQAQQLFCMNNYRTEKAFIGQLKDVLFD